MATVSRLTLKTLKWVAFVVPTVMTAAFLFINKMLLSRCDGCWSSLVTEIGGIALGAFLFSTWVFHLLSTSEARTRRTGEYLQRLIEGSQDAIVALDREGRVRLWNAGAEKLYGFTRDEAEGQVLPMLPAAERAQALEALRALRKGRGAINREDAHQRKDGRRVPVLVTLSPVPGAPGEGPDTLLIAKDLTAHKRVEAQRRRLAILEERQRIGMDLHDGAIQALYAVGLSLEALRRTLPPEAEACRERVSAAQAQLNGVIQDLRNYILDAHLPGLQAPFLRQGLLDLAERLRAEGGIAVAVDVPAPEDEEELPAEVSLHLLHIAREAVSNVLRHAQARRVDLRLSLRDGSAVLSVADDGRGFDPADDPEEGKLGLRNMRSRARLLGGTFLVSSGPGRGTEVRVEVPL